MMTVFVTVITVCGMKCRRRFGGRTHAVYTVTGRSSLRVEVDQTRPWCECDHQ